MDAFTLGVLYCHQKNQLFILFARDIESSIEYFFILSKILTFARNRYILLHATSQVAYYSFPHSL